MYRISSNFRLIFCVHGLGRQLHVCFQIMLSYYIGVPLISTEAPMFTHARRKTNLLIFNTLKKHAQIKALVTQLITWADWCAQAEHHWRWRGRTDGRLYASVAIHLHFINCRFPATHWTKPISQFKGFILAIKYLHVWHTFYAPTQCKSRPSATGNTFCQVINP